jgi:hypothetical protein
MRRCCSQRVPKCISRRVRKRSQKRPSKSSSGRLGKIPSSFSNLTWRTLSPSRPPLKISLEKSPNSIRSTTTGKPRMRSFSMEHPSHTMQGCHVPADRYGDEPRFRLAIWNQRVRYESRLLSTYHALRQLPCMQVTFISPNCSSLSSRRPRRNHLPELCELSV